MEFINADLIARGLSPFAPEKAALQAGKIMLNQIAANVSAGRSFAFEATLAGLNYARHIPRWRKAGYHVKLVFLSLPSADLAVGRVAARVRQGGHSVPEPVIRRRFDAGLKNFHQVYKMLVNGWMLYDSAGSRRGFLKKEKIDEGEIHYAGPGPSRFIAGIAPGRTTRQAACPGNGNTLLGDAKRQARKSQSLSQARGQTKRAEKTIGMKPNVGSWIL